MEIEPIAPSHSSSNQEMAKTSRCDHDVISRICRGVFDGYVFFFVSSALETSPPPLRQTQQLYIASSKDKVSAVGYMMTWYATHCDPVLQLL